MAMDPNARLVRGDIWQDPSMGHHWKITGLDLEGARVHIEGVGTQSGTSQRIPIGDFVRRFTFIRRGNS